MLHNSPQKLRGIIFMARLPQPGGDQGNWGEILNDFLRTSHDDDGFLKDIPQSKITNLQSDLAAKADTSKVVSGQLQVASANKRYIVFGGVIRNNGSPNYWQPITDESHQPVGIESVVTTGASITIFHPNLGAAKMLSYSVQCDEQLTSAGFNVGASVGTVSDVLVISRSLSPVQGVVRWTGTSWEWVGTAGVTFAYDTATGVLTVTHPAIDGALASVRGLSLTGRGASALRPAATNTDPTVTSFTMYWVNTTTGAVVTGAPTNDMRSYVVHGTGGVRGVVNPQSIDTVEFPSSNIWILGIYEAVEGWVPPGENI